MKYKNSYPNEFSCINQFLELKLSESMEFEFGCSLGSGILEEIFESIDLEKKDKTAKELIKFTGQIHQNLIDIYISYVEKKSAELTKKLNLPIPKDEQKQVFTVSEVQKIASIKSADTMSKYLKAGLLKGVKGAGNRWRIQREDLAAFLGHDNF